MNLGMGVIADSCYLVAITPLRRGCHMKRYQRKGELFGGKSLYPHRNAKLIALGFRREFGFFYCDKNIVRRIRFRGCRDPPQSIVLQIQKRLIGGKQYG